MSKHGNPGGMALPRGGSKRVKSTMLHIISMAQYARAWAANSQIARVRLKAASDNFSNQMKTIVEPLEASNLVAKLFRW